MAKNKIPVTVEVNEQLNGFVFLDDLIEAMNEIDISARWNYIAKIINDIRAEDIQKLDTSQKELIRGYLQRQAERFNL